MVKKVVDAFACYTGFILGSDASVTSMDELVSVSMSFIPEDVERFEQEFLTTIESYFSTRGEYSAAIQTEILNAVSRKSPNTALCQQKNTKDSCRQGRFITTPKHLGGLNVQRKVLLTGATGFLGSHVLIQLLNAGYAVRGSMRNLSRKEELMTNIRHTFLKMQMWNSYLLIYSKTMVGMKR